MAAFRCKPTGQTDRGRGAIYAYYVWWSKEYIQCNLSFFDVRRRIFFRKLRFVHLHVKWGADILLHLHPDEDIAFLLCRLHYNTRMSLFRMKSIWVNPLPQVIYSVCVMWHINFRRRRQWGVLAAIFTARCYALRPWLCHGKLSVLLERWCTLIT